MFGSMTRSFIFRHQVDDEIDPRWVHKLPVNPTIFDHLMLPFWSFIAWMRLLCDNYGWRFILMVLCGQHLLKGLLAGGGSQGLLVVESFIYMRLRVGASWKTVYQAIGSTAWGLKPLYALISDSVTIRGYRRTPWVIFTAIIASVAYATMAWKKCRLSGAMICLCFFCAKFQIAWTDLMVEATFTEKMRDVPPRFSADIVSFAWSGVGFFALLGIFFAGPGIDYLGPIHVVSLALPFACLVIIPASAGYLTEKRLPRHQTGLRMDHVRKQWEYFVCTIILIVGVLCTAAAGVFQAGPVVGAQVALMACLMTGLSSVVLLPTVIWKPMMYMFLANAFNVDVSGFVDNFYLDPSNARDSAATGLPICVNCPHFSATFYYTVIGMADSVFMLVGSFIFTRYLTRWSYRQVLCVSQVIICLTSILDIVQYQRWNLDLGLPDWVFMLGKASFQNTLFMINAMPTHVLMSKVCPNGVEASVFALLAGFSNFGMTVASYLGAYSLSLVGMDGIGGEEVDDFSGAWKACLLNAVVAPIALLLLPFLIPDARIRDPLPEDCKLGAPKEEVQPLLPDDPYQCWGSDDPSWSSAVTYP
eukprot:GGOE01005734.1.p1 GENE.GGOE01005734.1~~GGOE01005734.1.p1  ORF type:complete len:628 (+),score=126.49 GGOE01005734.1:124-1884(+)